MNGDFPGGNVDEAMRGAVEDLLAFAGRNVQLVTPLPTVNYDEQGDPIDAGSVTASTHAEIVERGEPGFAERAEGYEIEIEGIAWVPERITDEIEVTAGEGDRSQRATEIHDPDSGRWRVEYVTNERNGKLRCICRRLGG